METIYQEIANQIKRMIPEKWSSVYLYAEKWADYDTFYFYYYPKDDRKARLHYEITEQFQVNSTEFDQLEDDLRDTVLQLYEKQISQEEEPWTSMTFILKSTGEFRIEYGYQDLSLLGPVEKRRLWKEKHSIN
ncbi:immunity protein YezG family protein [Bhargavaea ginsengi]|uniref:immunity protein YezG family protein n=1 Tax=Bhargavaea ginsengi TaxID=426757 RepID=UPI003C788430